MGCWKSKREIEPRIMSRLVSSCSRAFAGLGTRSESLRYSISSVLSVTDAPLLFFDSCLDQRSRARGARPALQLSGQRRQDVSRVLRPPTPRDVGDAVLNELVPRFLWHWSVARLITYASPLNAVPNTPRRRRTRVAPTVTISASHWPKVSPHVRSLSTRTPHITSHPMTYQSSSYLRAQRKTRQLNQNPSWTARLCSPSPCPEPLPPPSGPGRADE